MREAGLEVYRNLLLGRALDAPSLAETKKNPASLRIEPLAVVSISDEIRQDVLEAIKLFQLYGIELKILSGDAAESVRAVAHEIGWRVPAEKVTTGAELDRLNEVEFAVAARQKLIFARLRPEHKLNLIKSLKRQKLYTAMLGDGVNDLPAIKEADLGIAMEEGRQITKEVADIVLLKNKFALLPVIFDEGNRVVNTINSIAKLFLTKNFLMIYLALAALVWAVNFPLTPRRVTVVNIFTIALPSFIVALNNRDRTRTRNFTLDLFSFVVLSGLFVCAAGFAAEFAAEKYFAASAEDVQMNMLTMIVVAAVANFYAVVLRSREAWTKAYLFYGIATVALFALFVAAPIDFVPLNWIKTFAKSAGSIRVIGHRRQLSVWRAPQYSFSCKKCAS